MVKFPSLHERDLPELQGRLTRLSADSFTDEKTGQHYFTGEVTVPPDQLHLLTGVRGKDFQLRAGYSKTLNRPDFRELSPSRYYDLDTNLLLRAYAAGIFPMADSRDAGEVYWVEPAMRGVLPLDGFKMSRSLAKAVRSDRFAVTADRAFARVIAACLSPSASNTSARRLRSAVICFSIVRRTSSGGLIFFTSTRVTLTPHLSVASSRIRRSFELI